MQLFDVRTYPPGALNFYFKGLKQEQLVPVAVTDGNDSTSCSSNCNSNSNSNDDANSNCEKQKQQQIVLVIIEKHLTALEPRFCCGSD